MLHLLFAMSALLARIDRVPVSSTAAAHTARPAAPTAADTLGWLIGRWTAKEPNDGDTVMVHMDCSWAPGHQAVLFHVEFTNLKTGKSQPHYDGMYLWDPELKSYAMWQVDEKGQVGKGTVALTPDGFDQITRVVHIDGKVHFTKVHIGRMNGSAFRLKAFFRPASQETWLPALDEVYERSKP